MIKITMPQAGQTMEEGSILAWRRGEGEKVQKGEILLEIETDKANVEVEANEDGILRKILCPEGVTVPVLAPIAIMGEAAEDISAVLAEARSELKSMLGDNQPLIDSLGLKDAGEAPVRATAPAVERRGSPGTIDVDSKSSQELKASPAARKLVRERGVDLSSLAPGSGPGGRILTTDLEKLSATKDRDTARRPIVGMRRAIARTLLLSKQTIPHFYMRQTIDAAPLLAFYRSEKAQLACTLNDVIVFACAKLLREFPAFRSRIEGDEFVESPSVCIGIAVGMEDGLRVPVLVEADQMSLKQLAAESRRIIEAAQKGKLEGAGRGLFTISNLGMFGIEEFAAIINPPEAAILAVGAIREDVIVKEGAMRAGRVLTMTLSADHRLIDGLLAAKFLARLKSLLETPDTLVS